MSAEATVVRNYIDWMIDLPWYKKGQVNIDLNKAIKTLDEDHFGLDNVKEWDWRQTEHGQSDDYSQSYLPHMDKENGMLMSLNLQAVIIQNPEKDNLNLGQSPWVKK